MKLVIYKSKYILKRNYFFYKCQCYILIVIRILLRTFIVMPAFILFYIYGKLKTKENNNKFFLHKSNSKIIKNWGFANILVYIFLFKT